jgi:hypothetical protein
VLGMEWVTSRTQQPVLESAAPDIALQLLLDILRQGRPLDRQMRIESREVFRNEW